MTNWSCPRKMFPLQLKEGCTKIKNKVGKKDIKSARQEVRTVITTYLINFSESSLVTYCGISVKRLLSRRMTWRFLCLARDGGRVIRKLFLTHN